MKIGDGDEHRTESGLKDEMSDQDGKSFGWMPRFVLSKILFKFFVVDLNSKMNTYSSSVT